MGATKARARVRSRARTGRRREFGDAAAESVHRRPPSRGTGGGGASPAPGPASPGSGTRQPIATSRRHGTRQKSESPLSKPSAKRQRSAAGLEGAEVAGADPQRPALVAGERRAVRGDAAGGVPVVDRRAAAELGAGAAAPRNAGDHRRAAVVRQALEHRTDLEQDAGQVAVDAAGADRPRARVLEQVVALGRDQAGAVVGERVPTGCASRFRRGSSWRGRPGRSGRFPRRAPGRSRRRRRRRLPSDQRGCRRWSRSRLSPAVARPRTGRRRRRPRRCR